MKRTAIKRGTKPMKRGRIKQRGFKRPLAPVKDSDSTKELQGKAWARMSRYVRLRDLGKTCITCDEPLLDIREYQAGHCFHDPSKGSPVSYDERNINGQCERCNMWKDGQKEIYCTVLVEMYGPTVLSELSRMKHQTMKGKAKKEWLRGIIAYLDTKIKELEG